MLRKHGKPSEKQFLFNTYFDPSVRFVKFNIYWAQKLNLIPAIVVCFFFPSNSLIVLFLFQRRPFKHWIKVQLAFVFYIYVKADVFPLSKWVIFKKMK